MKALVTWSDSLGLKRLERGCGDDPSESRLALGQDECAEVQYEDDGKVFLGKYCRCPYSLCNGGKTSMGSQMLTTICLVIALTGILRPQTNPALHIMTVN